MNVFSQNPAFQKREIQVSVSDPGSRVFAIDIVAHRLGWNLTFTKGPVAGFKAPEPGTPALSSEAVIEGLSHFLVQHVRVNEEKDVTERIEDVLNFEPSAEDGPTSDELALLEAEKTIEALTGDKADLAGRLEAAEQHVKILRDQLEALDPAASPVEPKE